MSLSRFRFLGALLALFALSLFYVESVVASLCPPETVAEASVTESGAGKPGHSGMHHGAPPAEDPVPEGSHPERCPMSSGMAGSCVASALPVTSTVLAASATIQTSRSITPTDAQDLLLAVPLFHPPRA
jgi:hypothetical protein